MIFCGNIFFIAIILGTQEQRCYNLFKSYSNDRKVVDGTLTIAICDDDRIFGHHVRNEIKRILDTAHVVHSISLFQTGERLLDAGFFDIVFLDIEMGGLNGIETAERLRSMHHSSRIIFVTSHKKYVFSAFDVAATHYLLKPLDTKMLEKVLIRILQELTTGAEYCYTVKCGTQVHRVPFAQILYAEIFGRNIMLHTTQGVFTFNGRMEELEQVFPKQFFRCHKSYLVNLAMVTRYDKETALLQREKTVPIARRKSAEFRTAFLAFLQEEGDII